MFSLIGGYRTMRIWGLRERSITHRSLLQGVKGGTVGGWGGWGGITWGETPDVDDEAIDAANHRHGTCTPT